MAANEDCEGYISIDILDNYVKEGLLRKKSHSKLPLIIWNYNDTVQWKNRWDKITIICRGLVTDNKGNIVARPFPKFFNLEEGKHEPTDDFEVFEKVDGSLGILFHYNNRWYIATRGSFDSREAKEGHKMLKDTNKLNKSLTYCIEIIHPRNRIVVNYEDYSGLIYLSSFDTITGEEKMLPSESVPMFDKCRRYNFDSIDGLKDLDWTNREGFVVRYSNGSRCKIKFDNYLSLTRIQSSILGNGEKGVLKNLIEGHDKSTILEGVPDEFHSTVIEHIDKLNEEMNQIFNECLYLSVTNRHLSGRDFANLINNKKHPHRSILFKMKQVINDISLDNIDIDSLINDYIDSKMENLIVNMIYRSMLRQRK